VTATQIPFPVNGYADCECTVEKETPTATLYRRDVDGPKSPHLPCDAGACLKLAQQENWQLTGKPIASYGDANIID